MNTIIEKIRAYSERLLNDRSTPHTGKWYEGYLTALRKMNSYISDLEKEEKPTNIDFEQELYKHFGQVKDFTLGLQIAKHFYELGCFRTAEKYDEIEYKRQRAEESVPKDLEEYASRAGFDYVDNIVQEHPGHRFNDHDVEYAYRDGIIAGAKWQAEQLLKGSPMPEDTVLFNKGVAEGKRLMMEDYPKWHKVQRGSCFDKHTNFILSAREGHFYCSSMEVPRDGYILLVDELERLPKED